MGPQLKGLTNFFLELREANDVEEERKRFNLEINNIQTKFRSKLNLSRTQKKKYLYKIIYIYVMGFDKLKELGIEESLQMVNSAIFSDKLTGYLSLALLVNREAGTGVRDYIEDVLHIMHDRLVADLRSENEDFNCFAIQFIAAKFGMGEDERENEILIRESDDCAPELTELLDMIYSLCCSPLQSPLVKKKAIIALLALARIYPQSVSSNNSWIPRLLMLLDNENVGVVMSAISLVKFLLDIKPQFIKSAIPSITRRLNALVVRNICAKEDYYYDIPAPWLTIRLLELLEHFFLLNVGSKGTFEPALTITDIDPESLRLLRQVISTAIASGSKPVTGLSNRRSLNAILFQAISVAAFLEPSADAINGAIEALMSLLDAGDTNIRYLSLEALIKLAARSQNMPHLPYVSRVFEQHLLKLFNCLPDRDISARRKCLDLIYITANPLNYRIIVTKLLEYFPIFDQELKSEIGIKVAVLAEKFATDFEWYVSTMLQLLSLGISTPGGGSYLYNEVWERVVQVIVNNDDLQLMTCKSIIDLLRDPLQFNSNLRERHETGTVAIILEALIKVSAFVLGEYGHLLGSRDDSNSLEANGENIKDYSVDIQFRYLYDAYLYVSVSTRSMLLTTFLKYFIKCPGLQFLPYIMDLFETESTSVESELQTRSLEYLRIATNLNKKFAQYIVLPMPPFETKVNPLMQRLRGVEVLTKGRNRSSSSLNALRLSNDPSTVSANRLQVKGKSDIGRHFYSSKSLLSNSLLPRTREEDEEEVSVPSPTHRAASDPFGDDSKEAKDEPMPLSPNWQGGFQRMCTYDAGIFYENQLIKLMYRIMKNGYQYMLRFTVVNYSARTAETTIEHLTVMEIKNMASKENPGYLVQLQKLPSQTVNEKTEFDILVTIRSPVNSSESPYFALSFQCGGSFNQLNLKFPVTLLKTIKQASNTSLEDMRQKWEQVGIFLGVEQGQGLISVNTAHALPSSSIERLMTRLGFAVASGDVPGSPQRVLMGAGVAFTQQTNFGVLASIKALDLSARVFEIAVRCTIPDVAKIIALEIALVLPS